MIISDVTSVYFTPAVPVARIQTPLQDALVPEAQDAIFTIELSASVIGSWFLNGTQLQDDERFSMRRSRTHQSLRIQGVRDTENGAEITFIAYGIRDSAALYIQGECVSSGSKCPQSKMDWTKTQTIFITNGHGFFLPINSASGQVFIAVRNGSKQICRNWKPHRAVLRALGPRRSGTLV